MRSIVPDVSGGSFCPSVILLGGIGGRLMAEYYVHVTYAQVSHMAPTSYWSDSYPQTLIIGG